MINLGPESIDYCDEYGNAIHTVGGVMVRLDAGAQGNEVNILSKPEDTMMVILHGSHSKVTVEQDVVISNKGMLSIFSETEVTIKKNCTIGAEFGIDCHSYASVYIDEDCMLSSQIRMIAGDGHSIFDMDKKFRLNPIIPKNPKNQIHIGKHCWIGFRSIILYSTCIGESSIVGAGSLVKGKFPDHCMIAGNPARKIRKNVTWDRNNFADYLDIIPK